MRAFIVVVYLIFVSAISFAQRRQCSCSIIDPSISTVTSCQTTVLRNKSKLYYQFNCDSVWLTLENTSGKKTIIYSMDGQLFKDLYSYNYRLGYQLSHEYNKYLLFRSGCPANGPCNFILLNKTTGKVFKEMGELIYDHSSNLFYDFLLYFSSDDHKYLALYYPDTYKKYLIPLINPKSLNALIPEYMFDKVVLKQNTLLLSYGKAKLNIDLNKYKP